MLDRQSVRAFVARQRANLDRRVASGELIEHVDLDQRDEFIDLLSGLSEDQFAEASDLYLQEKKALYEGRARQALAQAKTAELNLETSVEDASHTIGVVLGALVFFLILIGVALLARGG